MKKKRFRLLPKLVMLIFALYAAMTLIMLQVQLNEKRAQKTELETLVARQKITNSSLLEAIASEMSSDDIERIAREKFGLVQPGEMIFVDISR